MESSKSKQDSVFFHMGPGFHAKIEARAFSSLYPRVSFPDQPQDVDFPQLVDWACEQIRTQAASAQKPLVLLAHSFGGQIVAAALPRVTSSVSEIRFLNSASDSFQCFLNIGRALNFPEAADASKWFQKSGEEKMNYIFSLAQDPRFSKIYWNSVSAQKSYEQLGAGYPGLHLPTFAKVFSSYLKMPPPQKVEGWTGPVKIIFSKDDALLNGLQNIQPWSQMFKNAEVIELAGVGHYAHFESEDVAKKFFKG